jgi:O-antigen ligase
MIAALGVWLLAISLVLGQLVRFPLPGQSGGVLVSDIAVVFMLLVAGSKYGVRQFGGQVSRNKRIPSTFYVILTTPFILWSLFTLVIHIGDYSTSELAIAFSYWLRTSSYLLLLPALLWVAREQRVYQALGRSFVSAIVVLLGIGFIQILFFPQLAALPASLLALSGGGWDPHEGRLVSSWLDPNFFGAFAGLALLYAVGSFFTQSSTRRSQIFFLVLTLALGVAGILTQSRSSVIAAVAAVFILSPLILLRLASQRTTGLLPAVIGLGSLAVIVVGLAALGLGDRLAGLLTQDPTVQLRLDSLVIVWRMAKEHPLVGVGYNAFQFAARDAGLSDGVSLHSRAGADNSFLTLAVTTGIPGLLLFCLPWLSSAGNLLWRWLVNGQVVAITSVVSVLTLAIHAQFVNSFLYAHLLIVLVIVIVLAEAAPAYDQTV